jgi:hypothetical protein
MTTGPYLIVISLVLTSKSFASVDANDKFVCHGTCVSVIDPGDGSGRSIAFALGVGGSEISKDEALADTQRDCEQKTSEAGMSGFITAVKKISFDRSSSKSSSNSHSNSNSNSESRTRKGIFGLKELSSSKAKSEEMSGSAESYSSDRFKYKIEPINMNEDCDYYRPIKTGVARYMGREKPMG